MAENEQAHELSTIKLLDKDNVGRSMVVMSGIPFYCSTGDNSGFADTWFPFFGITPGGPTKGALEKPRSSMLPKEVNQKITELFPPLLYGGSNNALATRFGKLPCLLISSLLGGGIWGKPEGVALKENLEKAYPEFYSNISKVTLNDPELIVHSSSKDIAWINQINNWLSEKGNVADWEQLRKNSNVTLDELINLHLAHSTTNQSNFSPKR